MKSRNRYQKTSRNLRLKVSHARPTRSSLRLATQAIRDQAKFELRRSSTDSSNTSLPASSKHATNAIGPASSHPRIHNRFGRRTKRLVRFPVPDHATTTSQNWSVSFRSNTSATNHSIYLPSTSVPSSASDIASPDRPLHLRQLRSKVSRIPSDSSPPTPTRKLPKLDGSSRWSDQRMINRKGRSDSLEQTQTGEPSITPPPRQQQQQQGQDEQSKDEADDGRSDQERSETSGYHDGRRYPVRNRRHTAVYQIEYPQHAHGSTRNWLSGTGHECTGRRRRNRPDYASSTSSSGGDSDSSGSTLHRNVVTHTSWRPTATTNTTVGSEQADPDELRFARRCAKSIMHARRELMPINLKSTDSTGKSILNDRLLSGSCLADIEPMKIDESVGFDQVGGHNNHIMALKESIILPLMYPEVFTSFGIDPPRGVLFSGPPGTGKTLLARALANECSHMSNPGTNISAPNGPLRRPIAFFMRKGADCLSKWVGESERQLRLLFDQAYRMRPSIIFFDEIDGLAPVRSSRQDQIHSSIVSTLLSLMDGLDNRAEVVIIGATNRPDAIDPALRRPGRFDREFIFSLPSESVRLRILEVHTSKWNPKPDPALLKHVAHVTANYSGADLKALATEACLGCLRRQYPQVYRSQVKLALDQRFLVVNPQDWLRALQLVRPSVDRSDAELCSLASSPAANALSTTRRAPLSLAAVTLLGSPVCELTQLFTQFLQQPWNTTIGRSVHTSGIRLMEGTRTTSKIIIDGDVPDCLVAALWHKLELVQVFTLSYANLVAFPTSIGVSAEAAISQVLSSVKRATTTSNAAQSLAEANATHGVIVYLPHVDQLLCSLPRSACAYLVEQLDGMLSELVATEADCLYLLPSTESRFPSELSRAVSQRVRRLLVVATVSNGAFVSTEKRTSDFVGSASGGGGGSQSNGPKQANLCNGFTHGARRATRTRTNTPCSPVRPPSSGRTPEDGSWRTPIRELNCPLDDSSSTSDHSSIQFAANQPAAAGSFGKFECTLSHHRKRILHRFLGSGGDQLTATATTRVRVSPPNKEARAAFFTPLLMSSGSTAGVDPVDLDAFPFGLNDQFSKSGRPPSPLPIQPDENRHCSPEDWRQRITPEQLEQIEREENQLFRRLRQVLRRVVAHLARHRRFAVFSRPVQLDEAPDYYEVIKQPMDLGTVRDRIDAKQYTNVEDFMKDIELIYYNALEYNPANVPRSHDIRSRASEFWDEACLRIEEELHPPDLNDRCKAAAQAHAARASHPSRLTATSPRSRQRCSKSPATAPPPPEVKHFPLPQGDRYSRRLHGQPPVLGQEDIQVLQEITSRRRASTSAQLPNSETRQLRVKLGLDVDETTGVADAAATDDRKLSPCLNSSSYSETDRQPTNDTAILSSTPCNKTMVTSSSPGSPNVCSPIRRQTPSPDLSTTMFNPNLGEATTCHMDRTSLELFLNDVVDNTHGWIADELLALHREFVYAARRRTADAENLRAFVSDLQHIFNSFREQRN